LRMTVDTLVMYTGMLSSMGSSGPDAMGSSDGWPWRGSRMRPEMKDDAAVEGYLVSCILCQAVVHRQTHRIWSCQRRNRDSQRPSGYTQSATARSSRPTSPSYHNQTHTTRQCSFQSRSSCRARRACLAVRPGPSACTSVRHTRPNSRQRRRTACAWHRVPLGRWLERVRRQYEEEKGSSRR
jgi:hypothetical protein